VGRRKGSEGRINHPRDTQSQRATTPFHKTIDSLFICSEEQPGVGFRSRNGPAQFDGQEGGVWTAKLQALFDWDDEPHPTIKKRGWHRQPFRLYTRSVYSYIERTAGVDVAEQFRRSLGTIASRHLFIIPLGPAQAVHASLFPNPYQASANEPHPTHQLACDAAAAGAVGECPPPEPDLRIRRSFS